jgi:hypothetical protein
MRPVDRRRSALFVVLVVALCVVVGRPADAATDPLRKDQAGLAEIKAPEAWARGRGSGVSVAIVSTGVAEHPDLEGKVDGGFDATGTNPRQDADGRGTHLAGIVGAATDNGVGIAGVAPLARLLPFKAFETGPDDESQLIRALNETRAAKPAVVLVDVPAGYEGKDLLRQTLKTLGDAGTSVVVGAQSGLSLDDLPVLAVASGSGVVGARGVAAPGQSILSTTVKPPTALVGSPTYGYGPLSGTGQAAAHVAGAVAILRGLGADAGRAADLLRSTARRSGSTSQGAGVIDVAAAAAAYQSPAQPAPTTSTTKAAVKPAPDKQVKPPGGTIPPGQVVPLTPSPTLPNGEPAELGVGEEAVVPPGAEEFADGPAGDGGRSTTLIGGRERPWGTLTIGFGLLFGVGSGLSLTFRRLADATI